MTIILACLITLPNPDNHTGPDDQEIYLNKREGMLRVLDLMGDDMDACADHNVEELEDRADTMLENSGDASIRWTFVPIMDLTVTTNLDRNKKFESEYLKQPKGW